MKYREPEIPSPQILQQMERILSHPQFRQAKSLERFLRYVVTKTLVGEADQLKEYTLGVEVFQRGDEYDPRHDAVVRVQANVLRKRLAGYYEEEGREDEVVIALPKGHYVPEFTLRVQPGTIPAPPAQVVNAAYRTQRFWPLRMNWLAYGRVALIFAFGVLAAVAFQSWRNQPTALGKLADKIVLAPASLPLWEKFLQPGASNIVAYGTPQFFVSEGLYVRDVQVNSAEEMTSGMRLKAIEPVLKPAAPFAPVEIYTGVGETHGVYLLSKFLWQTTQDVQVTSSRMIRWQELKNTNVIFISSMRFHTLAKELPFPNDFTIQTATQGQIINLRPQPGEKPVYGRTPDDPINDYAVITLWPGKHSQQRILVLSGNTTMGTMAAAEYVTDPEYLRQLYQQLEQCRVQHGSAQHAPYFQVLVRTEVKDNQPFKIAYVTHHDLKIPDSTEEALQGGDQIAWREPK